MVWRVKSLESDEFFQLPLSGSRDHNHDPLEYGVIWRSMLSTPSLGITARVLHQRFEPLAVLSTPSLGITTDISAGRDALGGLYFQLPLSGSPSPIPGFFGSPRLSAAAPFRTNDS